MAMMGGEGETIHYGTILNYTNLEQMSSPLFMSDGGKYKTN